MALIELSNITKDYRMGEVTVHALRGLDLSVERGSFEVLLGPSGCGKTTTLNLIGGLDLPSSGELLVDGQNVVAFTEAQRTLYRRRRIGFVFQFFNLIPTLTASENIEFALALLGGRTRVRAAELLDLVGLSSRADHFPSQLSGGEQQRVAIARALANRPEVLLCDEPTGNLDVETGIQVLEVIRGLNRSEGTTVLLVTHNSAIAPMADRVVRLRSGRLDRVEQNGEPREVADLVW